MSQFCFSATPTQRLSSLIISVGEEARPILFKALAASDNVHTAFFQQNPKLLFADEVAASYTPQNSSRTLSLIGRTSGNGRFRAIAVPRVGDAQLLDEFAVSVRDVADRSADMTYTGRYLCWHGSLPRDLRPAGPLLFVATSGLVGHQIAALQKEADHGPLPEGLYTLTSSVDPKQASVEAANARGEDSLKNVGEGIQFLRIGGNGPVDPQWGTLRVRLTPRQGNMYGRGGFYLHNSHKGFSHGCIEVGKSPEGVDFFSSLLSYASEPGRRSQLMLRVKYADQFQSTLGKTQW
jgi:hypothetical protein